MSNGRPARTVVAFHAHPDDEALLTAGTMARAAAEGHRVVLVFATDGDPDSPEQGDAGDGGLGERRRAEAQASARVLGVARLEWLGYADSGLGPGLPAATPSQPTRFIDAPVAEAAKRLATLLCEEDAHVLLSYDRNGGYGHRDHVRVHEVGAEAARTAGTQRVLEATMPRDTICRVLDLATRLARSSAYDRSRYDRFYSARSEITHRISVRGYTGQKRASLRAHASQTAAVGGADRTLARFLRIPRPLYALVFGREWFVDRHHHGPVSSDIFAGVA